jgi:hypothetical protein
LQPCLQRSRANMTSAISHPDVKSGPWLIASNRKVDGVRASAFIGRAARVHGRRVRAVKPIGPKRIYIVAVADKTDCVTGKWGTGSCISDLNDNGGFHTGRAAARHERIARSKHSA